MAQDLLATLHRWSRAVAPMLGPFRGVARQVFRKALALRYPPGQLARGKQNGRTWLLDPEVLLRGEDQEFETVRWFRSVVEPGTTVIDVGANVGQMSLELAELVGPSGKVIAIEPGEGNLRLLRRHLQGNGLADRVEIIEAACTDQHGGTVRFYIVGENADTVGSGHTLAGDRAIRHENEKLPVFPHDVPAVSIDGICAERKIHPAMIKIDVEGAELSVLKGALRTLREDRPKVRVGFHPFAFEDPVRASDELRALFRDAGYTFDGPASGVLALAEFVATPGRE